MEEDNVSPSKFSTLPPDLQARIFRQRLQGGTVTRQYRELTIEDRIQDAGTKPFSESELQWFINVRCILAIMFESENRSRIMYFQSNPDRAWRVVTRKSIFSTLISGKYVYFNIITVGKEFQKSKMVKFLVGRFDSQIIKNIVLSDRLVDDEEKISMSFNVVILDLRSIFILLKHRFEIIVEPKQKAVELARKYTQLAFDGIVDDFQGSRLFSLLQYLVCNAVMLDVDINANDYQKIYKVNNGSLQEMTNKCSELYKILSGLIGSMA